MTIISHPGLCSPPVILNGCSIVEHNVERMWNMSMSMSMHSFQSRPRRAWRASDTLSFEAHWTQPLATRYQQLHEEPPRQTAELTASFRQTQKNPKEFFEFFVNYEYFLYLPVIVSESEQELKMCNIWHLSQKHQCNIWFGLFPTDLAPQEHVWNAQNSGLLWRSAFPEKKSGLFCDPPNRKFFFHPKVHTSMSSKPA